MEEQVMNLSVHPQILDLYTVLEQNGLSKQKEEIQSLVSYIENMENKLSEMSEEIENMHKALERMNDRKFRNKCQNIISSIEEKIQQARTMISVTKVKLVNFADNAVKTFREKGHSTLLQMMNALKVPELLSHMRDGFAHASDSMFQHAEHLKSAQQELHEIGAHFKNFMRYLAGKPVASEKLRNNAGAGADLIYATESCGHKFFNMKCKTDDFINKICKDTKTEEKVSVKGELNNIKKTFSEKVRSPIQKEQVR